MSKKVMPCPACGDTPEVVRNGDGYLVYCEDHPRLQSKGRTRDEAIDNFNSTMWCEVSAESAELEG